MYNAGIEYRINQLVKKPAYSRTFYETSVTDGAGGHVLVRDYIPDGALAIYVFFLLVQNPGVPPIYDFKDNTNKILFSDSAVNSIEGFYYLFETGYMKFSKTQDAPFSVGFQYIFEKK